MKDMKLNYALLFAVLLQAVGLIWYVSKMDSKINILYDKFEKENETSVIENQVKMKLDLEYVMTELKKMQKDLKASNKTDKKIMKQHDQIFEMLQNNEGTSRNYSYD
jgi:predicted exporter